MNGFLLLILFVTSLSATNSATPVLDPSLQCPPGKTKMPHPVDCSAFYLCAYGLTRLGFCSAGLDFNPQTEMCENPSTANCKKQCDPLVDDVGGTWDPPSCAQGPSDVGTSCRVKCNTDYELRGSSSIECTEYGWNSTNGQFIPQCVELECYSQAFEDELNQTLSVDAGLLFVLDESGSIDHQDYLKSKEFIKQIVQRFPLSENRSAGVITFSDDPIVRIHLSETSTSSFMNQVDNIPHRAMGTDVLEALEGAIEEINHYKLHPLNLVILITDGISDTDATPAADSIKKSNPLFAIGVGKTLLSYVESLASVGNNGIKHFFHTRNFSVLENIGKYLNRPATSKKVKTECKFNARPQIQVV